MRVRLVFSFFVLILTAGSSWARAEPAAPEPLVGAFRFAGVYRMESVQKNEVVSDWDESGKKRLEQLRAEGFACVLKTNHWHACAKHVAPPVANEELDLRVRSRWGGFEVVLEKPISDLRLEFNTEFYRQWSADQKALAGGVVSYRTKYAWTQGIWKLYLDRGAPELSPMFLLEEGRVGAPDTFTLGSERVWDRFFVVVDLFSR